MLAAFAGITATSQDGSLRIWKLLLLPFNARAHPPLEPDGLLAPFESDTACSRIQYRALSRHTSRKSCAGVAQNCGRALAMVYEDLR